MEVKLKEEKKIGYGDIIKDKNFCLFMLGNLISRFGDSIDTIAYAWMVYKITGSTALMALLFGVNAIPTILFQPIAGVFVDYRKKKNIVVICNFGRATVVTVTALMFIFGFLKPYHLFIFTFMNSTFESFEGPAGVAAYPLIIEKEKFAYARAVQSTLSRIVELVGLAVAAGIIAVIGIGGGMIVNAVTFYLCGIFMSIVKYKDEVLKKQALNMKVYFGDLKAGFSYLRSKKILMSITIFAALINILIIPFNTLVVAYVNDELLKGPEVVAMLSFSLTAGMLVGGAIYPKLAERLKGIKMFIISGIILGIAYLSLAFVPMIGTDLILYGVIILVAFLFGMSASIFTMIINVTFMQKTEQEYLGRAAGIFNSLVMMATPVGSFFVATLCAFLSIPELFLIFGIGMVVLFIFQRYNKSIQEI
ncbi:MFS transporter [Clostridium sp.]|uniref:MFS transporter n=1 Tax=Clostridium sp. TaxID=1506 RepID=UPI0032170229